MDGDDAKTLAQVLGFLIGLGLAGAIALASPNVSGLILPVLLLGLALLLWPTK